MILMDDFTLIEDATETDSPGSYKVRIYPHTTQDDNFCWVDLQVSYKPGYPQIMPDL